MKNTPVNYGKNGFIAIAGENVRNKERFKKYARKIKAMEVENKKQQQREEIEERKYSF